MNQNDQTYHENHTKVLKFIHTYAQQNKTLPGIMTIVKGTGLSYPTCTRHYDAITIQDVVKQSRPLLPQVVLAIANSALRGNAASQKLFVQLHGWNPAQLPEAPEELYSDFEILEVEELVELKGLAERMTGDRE